MKLGLIAGRDFELSGSISDIEISGLTADSRQVRPGYLFAAFSGTHDDGTKYIGDAIKNGAVAVLLSTQDEIKPETAVTILKDPLPRSRFAKFAANFYRCQPRTVVAVTGTNGKTSVASFVRQIWQAAGFRSASIGTIGIVTAEGYAPGSLTTPDPVTLHQILADLYNDGITHLAMEASSHGLQQHRLDGVKLSAAAFTNISRDHLDYHNSFEEYLAQKSLLFSDRLGPGQTAVIDIDSEGGSEIAEVSRRNGLEILSVGHSKASLQVTDVVRQITSQELTIRFSGSGSPANANGGSAGKSRDGEKEYHVILPLVGDFQVSNALVAAGLCIATGLSADQALPALSELKGEVGRLEFAANSPCGGRIYIDYAHTPDALKTALNALRPYVERRLIVVFGCGGDRDRGKRPEMGNAARTNADLVYVTDDNPRGEPAEIIRKEIMKGCPGALEIADRKTAIAAAIDQMSTGDILLIAGKGHETGQIIGDKIIDYSDHTAVRELLSKDK